MAGLHRKPSTVTRQKQALRAGAVVAPLAAGLMLSASGSAIADEFQSGGQQYAQEPGPVQAPEQPTPYTSPSQYPTQDQVIPTIQANNDLPTDGKTFGWNPNSPVQTSEDANNLPVFSDTGASRESLADACAPPNNCQVNGGQINMDNSFWHVDGPSHYGNSMVDEGQMTTDQTATQLGNKLTWKNAEGAEVSASATGKAGVPFVAEGSATYGGKISYGHENGGEYTPPTQTVGTSKTEMSHFNPGPQGAHQSYYDHTAQYDNAYITMFGQKDENGNDMPVDLDDGVSYKDRGTGEGHSVHVVQEAPPKTPSGPNLVSMDSPKSLPQSESQTSPTAVEDGNEGHYTFDQANPYSPRYHGRIDWPWDGQSNGYNYATGKYDQGSYDKWAEAHQQKFGYYGDEANPYHRDYHGRKGPDMGGYIFDKTHYNYETKQYDGGPDAYWEWRRAHPELYPSDNG